MDLERIEWRDRELSTRHNLMRCTALEVWVANRVLDSRQTLETRKEAEFNA